MTTEPTSVPEVRLYPTPTMSHYDPYLPDPQLHERPDGVLYKGTVCNREEGLGTVVRKRMEPIPLTCR